MTRNDLAKQLIKLLRKTEIATRSLSHTSAHFFFQLNPPTSTCDFIYSRLLYMCIVLGSSSFQTAK